jgi:hypothetical protein
MLPNYFTISHVGGRVSCGKTTPPSGSALRTHPVCGWVSSMSMRMRTQCVACCRFICNSISESRSASRSRLRDGHWGGPGRQRWKSGVTAEGSTDDRGCDEWQSHMRCRAGGDHVQKLVLEIGGDQNPRCRGSHMTALRRWHHSGTRRRTRSRPSSPTLDLGVAHRSG